MEYPRAASKDVAELVAIIGCMQPAGGLDGPSVPVRVEPIKLPDVTPAPAREAPAEPAPAPPQREPEPVPA